MEQRAVGADPAVVAWYRHRLYRHALWRGRPIRMAATSGVDTALQDIGGEIFEKPVCKETAAVGNKLKPSARVDCPARSKSCTLASDTRTASATQL